MAWNPESKTDLDSFTCGEESNVMIENFASWTQGIVIVAT